MEFRGIMGGFYRISEWIMRLSVINVLWVVCSIPVFILGVMTLQVQDLDQLMSMLIVVGIVSPFTLFPATSAMFGVARKWLTGEEDAPLFKTFFRGYKENYLQSMLGGLIYVLLGIILYVNFRFYSGQASSLGILKFLILSFTVVLMISMFHFFSITVHLHMKLFQILKNSILITIGNPIRSIFLIVVNGLILYISAFKFTFLIPFFMGSLVAIVSFWTFNQIFAKIQEKQQKWAEENEEKSEEAGEVQGGDGHVKTEALPEATGNRQQQDDPDSDNRSKPTNP